MSNIGELIWAAGILTLVGLFDLSKPDPIHIIEKVPVCEVSCTVQNAEVICASTTKLVWSDFTQRVVDNGGYCGPCGSPAKCPEIKQFDEYKKK